MEKIIDITNQNFRISLPFDVLYYITIVGYLPKVLTWILSQC